MKLRKVSVENFRCYNERQNFELDNFLCVVGQNDAGKSALFEALDIFFNGVKPDGGDCCIHNESTDLIISCSFDELPEEIVIDESAKTTLADEYLLDEHDYLTIEKHFDYHPENGTAKLKGTFVRCHYPSESQIENLHGLTINKLKSKASSLKLDLDGVDSRASSELRKAIWRSIENLNLSEKVVSLEKDRKSHWQQIQRYMPVYSLFKADRSNSNSDSEIQDPLKAAIKEATKDVEEQLEEIKRTVLDALDRVAIGTLEKVRELDEDLASELRASVESKDSSTLFSAQLQSDGGIPLDKRGTGIRRLILLSFFRANLERRLDKSHSSTVIYAIEEPETGQHPNFQRMLLKHLESLSRANGVQVLVTSHSPGLTRFISCDDLIYLRKNRPQSPIVVRGTETDAQEEIMSTLGIFPNHSVKVFLGVEGKTDISFWRNLTARLSGEQVEGVKSFQELEQAGQLVIFTQGGSNLSLASSELWRVQVPQYHIFDRDNPPPEDPKYFQAANDVIDRGHEARHTARKELENYYPIDLISRHYRARDIAIALPDSFQHFDDVGMIVAKAVCDFENGEDKWTSLSTKARNARCKNVKERLAEVIVPDFAMLQQEDPDNELLRYVREITAFCT